MAITNKTPGSYKGGSYANHPSMRYELPIPFTPCGPPSDAYREGWDRVFGPKCLCPDDWKPHVEKGVAGHVLDVCPLSFCPPKADDAARVQYATDEQRPGGHYHIDFPDADEAWEFSGPCWCDE